MAETTLTIAGMFCAGCARTVKNALRSVPGVGQVTVDLGGGSVAVIYNPSQADVSRMMGAVAAAGYQAAPGDATAGVDGHPSIESMLRRKTLEVPILAGVSGGVLLLAVYMAILSVAQSPRHALDQLSHDAWFVLLITAGFGLQVSLFVHLQTNIRRSASAAGTAGSGVMSTAAMAACCVHHVVNVVPFLGLTAAAVFLNEYRVWFMIVALGMTAGGVALLARTIHRVTAGTSAPTQAGIAGS